MDSFVNKDDGNRINPATEELQKESLNMTSTDGGTQRVTLSSGTAQGSSQACKYCRLQCHSDNTAVVRIRIYSAITDGTTGLELAGNPVVTPYCVKNVNQLYFYSADATAIVDIEWYN